MEVVALNSEAGQGRSTPSEASVRPGSSDPSLAPSHAATAVSEDTG